MKTLIRALAFFALALMAMTGSARAQAFEHTGSAKVTSASTTGPSFNLTCDGSAGEKAVVFIGQQSATASVTIGGNAMTEVPTDSPQINNGYQGRMFTKDSPGSGSLAVAVTWGSAIVGNAVGACYSGAATGLDAHGGGNNGNVADDPIALSVTVNTTNSWLIGGVVMSTGPTDPIAGSGTTRRVAISDANTIAVALVDSNGGVGAGSQTLNAASNGGAGFEAGVIIAIAPAAGGGSTRKRMPIGSGGDR